MLISCFSLSKFSKGVRGEGLTCARWDLRTFARKFSSRWIFLKFLLRTDNELLVSEIQKKVGVTDFVSEIKSVENYPDFEKLAHVISHGFQGS